MAVPHSTSIPPSEFPQDTSLDNQALQQTKQELGEHVSLSELLRRAQEIKQERAR